MTEAQRNAMNDAIQKRVVENPNFIPIVAQRYISEIVEAVLAVTPEIKFEWHRYKDGREECSVNGWAFGSAWKTSQDEYTFSVELFTSNDLMQNKFDSMEDAKRAVESAFSSWYHSIGRAEK